MMTESTIKELRRIMIDNHRCFGCGHEHRCGTRGCAIMRNAADTLEAQQARIAELEAELKEERYRHDRLQDFEVAEAQVLAKLREERRWIPVGERLPDKEFWEHKKLYEDEDLEVQVMIKGAKRATTLLYNAEGEFYAMHNDGETFYVVTHWRPLPEPPEVDG